MGADPIERTHEMRRASNMEEKQMEHIKEKAVRE